MFWLVIVIAKKVVALEYQGNTLFNTESNLQNSSG